MGNIRKLRRVGTSLVVTIPPVLGYTEGDRVAIEERTKGVSFCGTKVATPPTDEPVQP